MSILAVVLVVVLVLALVGSWPGGPVVAHGPGWGPWAGTSLVGVLLAVLVVLLLLRVL